MTVIAPYFSLARALWVPAALTWDAATGELRRVEGPQSFEGYRLAAEASCFLARAASAGDKEDPYT